ncbi:hypothetical protein TPHA_0F03670 [Tetrapisispora phaffii CBS 4417]|uniref:5-oxoprolinase n=1 Tax=Tetrapisispora phaffii (strain ATCC 24235 / CBS 4417 / NBRC 1672 / NRRL Y-8282 / UCD 70-5) TaxID=1071381 RepID=G8BUR1_TETPH|nr:hypothetical protein TPHA_0F03670 [Tetrapisispora phaffii CBS 4417]CCE63847.1 hypothetical protein TPHA_0F03670 [Tetrapisispora phaffii CBS 4417]
MVSNYGNIRIAIDRGGTFTDCIGNIGTGKKEDDRIIKLLSVDPKNYDDAPLEGIRRLLEIFENKTIPRNTKLDISNVQSIRMGTTLATNCALERNGEDCCFITTKGFKDTLLIGDQTRPNIFELNIARDKLKPLFNMCVEIDERITLEDFSEDPEKIITKVDQDDDNLVIGKSGEAVRIIKKPDLNEIRSTLNLVYQSGIRSIAVAFVHSYTYPNHELLIKKIAEDIGFEHISLSSEISPMIKFLPRAYSAVADAYLTPVIKNYLKKISHGLFIKNDSTAGSGNTLKNIQFMQSDGGLVEGDKFSGLKSILSGPAGGIVGYAETCYDPENSIPLIGFDMGGTSTDVSRYGSGKLQHVFETVTAGITIQSPQLDIHTIAAGGSSILSWENGLFKVGPKSASADPGPACYRKNGPLTITDANLYLGRLIPEMFPHIFGPNENEPLDLEITKDKFEQLTTKINKDLKVKMTTDEVVYGFLKVACESMARPIRALTEAKGYEISKHRLVSFGGAGGQHAVAVAESLGIDTVLIHRYSSVLSAYGIFLANVVEEQQKPSSLVLSDANSRRIVEKEFKDLELICKSKLYNQNFFDEDINIERYLNLRYEGTETGLMILQEEENIWNFQKWFSSAHHREFGFSFDNKRIIVDDIRVRAIGKSNIRAESSVDKQLAIYHQKVVDSMKNIFMTKSIFFENKRIDTPIYQIEKMEYGTQIRGPAILADSTQTNVLPPNAIATVLESHIFIKIDHDDNKSIVDREGAVNPVLLSIFSHRFMDIAEQMGTQLRKTSVSTNVKERLDFSCALFDNKGNLVANAPHVPVHLGSMSTCIKLQAKLWEGKLKPNDVLITNHPEAGGTHLPDITVISPTFSSDGDIIFYVASRAHHAEIGGILPGSIPPNSKELYEEGVAIYSELLVKEGIFQEDMVYKWFVEEPGKYYGCSGSRKVSDNISDLKAQIAANTKGIHLINTLITDYSLDIIIKYMKAIQQNACETIKKMLKQLTSHYGRNVFESEDRMDDGSLIKLKVTLNNEDDEYIFNFSETSSQVYGNLNAPEAITNSAILYCLRCLVGEDIPLNQGCLEPLTIIIPKGSILSPNKGAAVVGGNVLTSQRVTDVILKTFNVMADSQGDCNNFTFGTKCVVDSDGDTIDGFGYYETICGGVGAGAPSWRGDGWDGASAVHTNMTNTRMTDPEVFEKRYPVLLREFSIRENSGGNGHFRGGCGVIRKIEFRKPVIASILSERRVLPPNGLHGGMNGLRGENTWFRSDTSAFINIGGKNTVNVQTGDVVIIKTPGGGGYGVKITY